MNYRRAWSVGFLLMCLLLWNLASCTDSASPSDGGNQNKTDGQSTTACGSNKQTCCKTVPKCVDPLVCCAGVPYPNDGICQASCPAVSDRALKENFRKVKADQVLERIVELPVTNWNYIAEDDKVRHIGPMAQDFHAAFGLGSSERVINLLDANGVVLLAIQALNRKLDRLSDQNRALHKENTKLRRTLKKLVKTAGRRP